MTNEEFKNEAMRQSAIDLNCNTGDFLKKTNVITDFRFCKDTKKYYEAPIGADFVSYGNNVVVSATAELFDIVGEYISRYSFYHLFETPNIYWLNEKLKSYNQKVCFMAEYWLPDLSKFKVLDCKYETKLLFPEDFEKLYTDEWSNALCKKRKELDVLGVGAFENGKMAGFAACSADAENMWQIGVDTLPEYRNRGIASSLTSRLAYEIMLNGKVPFYCCAWSNVASARNAIKSGFTPAWAEITVKPVEFIDKMNKKATDEKE